MQFSQVVQVVVPAQREVQPAEPVSCQPSGVLHALLSPAFPVPETTSKSWRLPQTVFASIVLLFDCERTIPSVFPSKLLPVIVFEDEIENHLARRRFELFQHDPLSIGIAIAYLTALVNEVRNLRVIGRGKSAGWKREEIEKELRLWLN